MDDGGGPLLVHTLLDLDDLLVDRTQELVVVRRVAPLELNGVDIHYLGVVPELVHLLTLLDKLFHLFYSLLEGVVFFSQEVDLAEFEGGLKILLDHLVFLEVVEDKLNELSLAVLEETFHDLVDLLVSLVRTHSIDVAENLLHEILLPAGVAQLCLDNDG